jgi:tyrosine-protein phosphatase YwqE
MTCQFCQETTSVVEEVEEEVKKSFTVVSVDLQYNNPKRRMVQAEIKIDYTKDKLAETVKESEYVKIEWPAYENMHYTAQVMPSNGGSFNYKDAREISKVLKQFIGEE